MDDLSSTALFIVDKDGNVLSIDETAKVALGIGDQKIACADSLLAPSDSERFKALHQQALTQGRTNAGFVRFQSPEGDILAYTRIEPPANGTGDQAEVSFDIKEAADLKMDEAYRFFLLSHDLMATLTPDGTLRQLNPAWHQILKFTKREILDIGLPGLVHPDDSALMAQQLAQCQRNERVHPFEVRIIDLTGVFRWFECDMHFANEEQLLYAIFHDIEVSHADRLRLEQNEERLRILVENVDEYLYSVKYDRWKFVDTYHSAKCAAITGYTPQDFLADNTLWYAMIHPEDRPGVIEQLEKIKATGKPFYIEHRIVTKSGTTRWISNSCVAVSVGETVEYIGFIIDITERRDHVNELHHLATTDPMTGVFNRRTGMSFLDTCLKRARRYGTHCTVCFIDLNDLKKVNDTFGHVEGDAYITMVARLCGSVLRESDMLSRFGGDEFVAILDGTTQAQAEKLVQRIESELQSFNALSQKHYQLSISTGIAEFAPESGVSMDELLLAADNAMYEQKVRFHRARSPAPPPVRTDS